MFHHVNLHLSIIHRLSSICWKLVCTFWQSKQPEKCYIRRLTEWCSVIVSTHSQILHLVLVWFTDNILLFSINIFICLDNNEWLFDRARLRVWNLRRYSATCYIIKKCVTKDFTHLYIYTIKSLPVVKDPPSSNPCTHLQSTYSSSPIYTNN